MYFSLLLVNIQNGVKLENIIAVFNEAISYMGNNPLFGSK